MKSLRVILMLLTLVGVGFAQTVRTQADIDAHRAKVDQAITARDYAAWKAEHEAWNPNNTRITDKVTAENFEKFAQMREARKSGDMEKAQQLRTELGIEGKGGKGGKGHGDHKGMGNKSGKGKSGKKGSGQGSCGSTQS